MSLPRHLRFLEDLASEPGDLEEHFPKTAAGTLKPRPSEDYFHADGIQYIGDKDGTMVPVDAENLEPMEENIWTAQKFGALVAAIQNGAEPVVYPGYADLWEEDGQVHGQVRDGNHRAFAPIAAGADFTWVMISDHTRQDLDDGKLPDLYKAIRAAQKDAGVPLFKKKEASKLRVSPGAREELARAEREYDELLAADETYYKAMLQKYGPMEETAYDLQQQFERPQLFWRLRLKELPADVTNKIFESKERRAHDAVFKKRMALSEKLGDMRQAAGLGHLERLDPTTGKVVKRNGSMDYAPTEDRNGNLLRPGDYVSFKLYPRGTARGVVVVSARTLAVLPDGSTAPALAIDADGEIYGMPPPKGVTKLVVRNGSDVRDDMRDIVGMAAGLASEAQSILATVNHDTFWSQMGAHQAKTLRDLRKKIAAIVGPSATQELKAAMKAEKAAAESPESQVRKDTAAIVKMTESIAETVAQVSPETASTEEVQILREMRAKLARAGGWD